MPCVGTQSRELLYGDILLELDALIAANSDCLCLIGGDFNTNLDSNINVTISANNFIRDNLLSRCDVIFPVADNVTYFNETTGCGSAIDYMLTSSSNDIIAFNILDMDINLSDHIPIMAVLVCHINLAFNPNTGHGSQADIEHFRWDHAPLGKYYEQTRVLLQPVLTDLDELVNSSDYMDIKSVANGCDVIYNNTVDALRYSANLCIPKHRKNFYKFWWTQELDVLKDKAIASCRIWKNAGKPRNGPIQMQYKKDKLLYKKRIREEQAAEICSFSNDLHDALLCKSGQDFWKVWKSKFGSNSADNILVDGIADGAEIANNFAKHFEANCRPFNSNRNEALKAQYIDLRADYCGSPITDDQLFDVELVGNLISSMKNGKAAGLDELTCEHLKFSHPIVACILTKLFNLFVSVGHIPASFGASYTVPIPKCDGRSRALSVDDFRGISISPVISKLFEMVVLSRFSKYFETSDHQFGFKKHLGCRDAIYSVRNVIENFISNGSTVNVCALDLSKAFDRMNHFALFIKLMNRKLPVQLLTLLEIWFSVSVTCVKWNGHVSFFFTLVIGVRQGGGACFLHYYLLFL